MVRSFFASLLFVLSSFAFALDYSSLVSAVDVGGVSIAFVSIAALMIAVVVAGWGIRKILSFFEDSPSYYEDDESRLERERTHNIDAI